MVLDVRWQDGRIEIEPETLFGLSPSQASRSLSRRNNSTATILILALMAIIVTRNGVKARDDADWNRETEGAPG